MTLAGASIGDLPDALGDGGRLARRIGDARRQEPAGRPARKET
jgi:hypothetical protein